MKTGLNLPELLLGIIGLRRPYGNCFGLLSPDYSGGYAFIGVVLGLPQATLPQLSISQLPGCFAPGPLSPTGLAR